MPGTQTSGTDLAHWAATHHDRLVVMMLLNTTGVMLWFVFGAAVWTYLRDRLPARSMLPACFAAGLVGFATLILAGFTAFDVLLYRDRRPELSTLLYDLAFGSLAMSGVPTAVSLASFAIAVYTYQVLPRHTAHLAIAAAAAHPILLAAFIADNGPLSLQGLSTTTGIPIFLFAWILATGLAMPRKPQGSTEE
ncbi:MAG: hypothetical protein JOZ00_15750 [Mycobacterium sp.]|nr:hypothetical protein [Mycobacterium sp.]